MSQTFTTSANPQQTVAHLAVRSIKLMTVGLLTVALLTGCSGVPITSVPRLLRLNSQLLEINPAEFMVAIQMDARMTPLGGGAAVLEVDVIPNVPSSFQAVSKKIPFRSVTTDARSDPNSAASSLGLQAAPAGRRWVIYSFAPDSQAELQRLQGTIKQFMQDRKTGTGPGKDGGKITAGIAQESIPTKDPAFANTRWESWLQTRRSEGFFELWSGTVGALLKSNDRSK